MRVGFEVDPGTEIAERTAARAAGGRTARLGNLAGSMDVVNPDAPEHASQPERLRDPLRQEPATPPESPLPMPVQSFRRLEPFGAPQARAARALDHALAEAAVRLRRRHGADRLWRVGDV